MGDAGRGEALRVVAVGQGPTRKAVEATMLRFLEDAGGDPYQALALAVHRGLATAELVSVGFVRWGQPDRRR